MSDSPKYLSGKLSYQGKMLDARIESAMRESERRKKVERSRRLSWLEAQARVLRGEDDIEELLAVKRIDLKRIAKEKKGKK